MINGVRQFKLINRTGAEYDMTRPERLFHNPDGLGWGTEREIRRIGMTYFADDEKEIHQRPTGEMVFRTYAEYAAFLSFCQVGGLVLAYKPRETWYYAKCLISINKSEIKVDTLHLVCPVNFTLVSYWYERVVAETATPEDPAEPTYISLSGETVSFAGAYEYPLANLEVDIQGSQDLNGYSKPWAGGAGKNLFEVTNQSTTLNGVSIEIADDGTIDLSGTSTRIITFVLGYITPQADTAYVVSGSPFPTNACRLQFQEGSTTVGNQFNDVELSVSGLNPVQHRLRLYIASNTNVDGVVLKPMIRKAGTSDTFEPYENIAPITAFNSVTITQTGNSETKTYDVELTGAGNVYKGTLNVTTGVLTVDFKELILTGVSEWWTRSNTSNPGFSYFFRNGAVDAANTDDYVCDSFDIYYGKMVASTPIDHNMINISNADATSRLRVMMQANLLPSDTVSGFETWLSNNPVTLYYRLAEPLTYQLTPTEIKNLIGNQVISANSGDIIDATVRTDGPNVYKIYPYRYSYQYGAGISNVFDFDLDLPSYFKLTIFGEINNPSWRLLVNGEIVKTGAMQNLTVSSTQKFVLNTNPKEMEIRLYSNRDVRVGSVYGKSDFTTERIFELPKGRSQLQIMTDDENIPKVMIEVLKHV